MAVALPLCYLLLNSAFGDTITFSFHDGLGNPITNTECIFTQKGISANGPLPGLTTSATFSIFTDSNGSNSSPNFQGGTWNGHLKSNPDTYFQIIVPGDGGTHFFGSLLTNLSTLPQGIFLNASNTSGPSNFLTLTTNGTTVTWTLTYSTNALTNGYAAPVSFGSNVTASGVVSASSFTNRNGGGIDNSGDLYGVNANVGQNLSVGNNATVSGLATIQQLQVNGTTIFQGSVSTSGSAQFSGNGSGLTNNGIQQIFTNGTPFNIFSNFLTTTPGNYYFRRGTYYFSNSLLLTNGVNIEGDGFDPSNGTHFVFATNSSATNFMLDEITNVGGCTIKGIWFDGLAYPNFASSMFIQPGNDSPYEFWPYKSGQVANTYTNRSGLRINRTGNNFLQNCKFSGFGAYGTVFVGTNVFVQNGNPYDGAVMGNIFCSNWCGAAAWGWQYDWAQPGGAIPPGTINNPTAEYALLIANHFDANGIGLYLSSGNLGVVGNEFTGNYVGVFMFGNGSGNPGHDTFTGDSVNHNTYGFSMYQSQMTMYGCQFLGDSYLVWDDVSKASLEASHFSFNPITLIVTNSAHSGGGNVIIRNNDYEGIWGSAVITNFNFGSGPGTMSVSLSGNVSIDTLGDTDSTAPSTLMTNNGGPITNLNLATNLTWSTNAVSWPSWTSNTLYQVTNKGPVQYMITITNNAVTAHGEVVVYFPNQTPAATNAITGTSVATNYTAVFTLLPNYWWAYTNLAGSMGIAGGSQMPLQ